MHSSQLEKWKNWSKSNSFHMMNFQINDGELQFNRFYSSFFIYLFIYILSQLHWGDYRILLLKSVLDLSEINFSFQFQSKNLFFSKNTPLIIILEGALIFSRNFLAYPCKFKGSSTQKHSAPELYSSL